MPFLGWSVRSWRRDCFMMKRYDHLCLLIKITLRSEEREREECSFLQLHVMYLGTKLGLLRCQRGRCAPWPRKQKECRPPWHAPPCRPPHWTKRPTSRVKSLGLSNMRNHTSRFGGIQWSTWVTPPRRAQQYKNQVWERERALLIVGFIIPLAHLHHSTHISACPKTSHVIYTSLIEDGLKKQG